MKSPSLTFHSATLDSVAVGDSLGMTMGVYWTPLSEQVVVKMEVGNMRRRGAGACTSAGVETSGAGADPATF